MRAPALRELNTGVVTPATWHLARWSGWTGSTADRAQDCAHGEQPIMHGHAGLGVSARHCFGRETDCKHGRGPREADEARGSWSMRLRKGRAWTAAMLVLALDEEPHS